MKIPKKIIIAGGGRAGTTFLVELLTELGEDTGINDPNNFVDWDFVKRKRAGHELGIESTLPDKQLLAIFNQIPRIIKSPAYSFWLKRVVKRGILDIEHLIVPVRDYEISAQSRKSVGLEQSTKQGGKFDQFVEANLAAVAVGRCVEASILFDIPLTLMHFPRLVKDWKYCYDRLSECFNFDEKKFQEAFKKIAKPDMIVFKEHASTKNTRK